MGTNLCTMCKTCKFNFINIGDVKGACEGYEADTALDGIRCWAYTEKEQTNG
jgi:hypothetical protein